MNIFWLDINPKQSVKYYVDKHVVKMITEYAQLLSTTCRVSGVDCGYKITHINHPCSIWCRASLTNWRALVMLTSYLHEEYQFRYCTNRIHKSFQLIRSLKKPDIPDIGLTIPPKVVPVKYVTDNVVLSYRNYYIGEKNHIASWTNREEPYWYNHNGILLK